ncbi:hypothetical protein AG1IA_04319 [Rhizoctonia solani AG-1 IA]|uniref:Uncharacterized protein n=1 Tax=Thanatephorus cucumeris (strain AG1-IA) TaxID=983506 RepID=L8WY08_THACA|nr:hypothetical protein AG1IA_04319 [Rhizoctonia solani AG-1 IA]
MIPWAGESFYSFCGPKLATTIRFGKCSADAEMRRDLPYTIYSLVGQLLGCWPGGGIIEWKCVQASYSVAIQISFICYWTA